MTRCRQKAALRAIRAVGFFARRNEGVADGAALGHIAYCSSDEALLAILEWGEADTCREFGAIGPARKQITDPGAHLAAGRLTQKARYVRAVTRVESFRDEQFDGLTYEPLRLIAEHTARGLIGKFNDPQCVHDEHRIRGKLQ